MFAFVFRFRKVLETFNSTPVGAVPSGKRHNLDPLLSIPRRRRKQKEWESSFPCQHRSCTFPVNVSRFCFYLPFFLLFHRHRQLILMQLRSISISVVVPIFARCTGTQHRGRTSTHAHGFVLSVLLCSLHFQSISFPEPQTQKHYERWQACARVKP